MRKQYLLLLALAISFVAFGVIAPIKASFNNVILNQACLAPENIAHTSLDGVSATLTWDYNGVGDSFEVFYGEDATVDEDDMVATETTSVDEVSLANLTPATTYYLWVRAECELADDDDETIVVYSAWEGPYTFTTPPVNDECAGAIVLTVNDSDVCVTSTTATFNGATLGDTQIYYCSQDIEGDVWFEFEAISSEHVVTLSGLSSVSGIGFNIYNTTDSACATGMGETCVSGGWSFTFEDLVVGDTYQVHVYTLTQDFTEEFQICITTNCPQPTEVSLVNGQLTWEYPEGVEATFEYIVSENPVPPTVTTPATGTTTDNFVTIEELNEQIDMEASTQYHFWVRAICDFNEDLENDWSDTVTFTTPPVNDECADAIVLTVNDSDVCVTSTTATFNGATLGDTQIYYCSQDIEGDVWFEFEAISSEHVVTLSGLSSVSGIGFNIYNTTDSACATGMGETCVLGGSSFTFEDLVVGDTYQVHVYTLTQDFTEEFQICITTNCPQPTEVSLVNGQLTWEYPEGVEATFEYIVSESSVLPTQTTPATGTTTDNFVTIEDLNDHIDMEASTQYHFWVRAICDFNEDLQNNWSDTFYFFVPPANDNCEDATTALVNEGSMCDDELWNEGTLLGATPVEYDEDGGQIPNGNFCTSTMVGDVWYEFTATSDRHSISFTGFNTTYNVYVAVYEGDVCGTGQPSIACASVTNIMNLEDLVIGQNYKIRVFTTSLTATTDFLMCITSEHDPIYVSTTDYTVPELVTEVLIGEAGDCAEVSNISWRTGTDFGKANGIGYFENDDPDFPMESGIILATGNVMQAPGPANNTTWNTGGTNGWAGDDDLKDYMNATLGNNDNYNDATVLEFDFRPMTDSLSFNFIFGSNEYGTFQCGYSDAFAFFLTDLATGVVTNLALVPNTTDPISVTTIRDCQYYNGSTCSDGG